MSFHSKVFVSTPQCYLTLLQLISNSSLHELSNSVVTKFLYEFSLQCYIVVGGTVEVLFVDLTENIHESSTKKYRHDYVYLI